MSSSQGKPMPKDTQIIMSIMNDLGIRDYEQQVLNHLLEFNYRYTTLILEEAKACSTFANKDEVDADDVKTAVQLVQDGVFLKSPPREELIKASNEINKKPLPAIKPASGLRIPQGSSNFLQTNYRLRTDLNTGRKVMKKSTKITAAEMLNATRQTEAISNAKTTTQSDLSLDDLTDIDIDEIIGSQQNNQDSDGDFNLDSLLCDPNGLLF
ncbi:transcription initiation factor TFIID subunit 9-like [Rhopalosiphum maidis]|uniref:transcription initiation factor TFIID subunit 9-like n=1 Tax=Rhopalosiphum maidis TaxID=43146 RepID=UPI000EFE8480|nr:transcription initiation factor TFIID subunit 9-like [Rhopalosiphum maidis]